MRLEHDRHHDVCICRVYRYDRQRGCSEVVFRALASTPRLARYGALLFVGRFLRAALSADPRIRKGVRA